MSISSQKYGFGIRDPRSGIRDPEKTYSGVKKAPDPGSGSATLFGRKPSALNREHPELKNMKFLYFFLFLVIFALLDPDLDPAT
jgi:hypothetical protein